VFEGFVARPFFNSHGRVSAYHPRTVSRSQGLARVTRLTIVQPGTLLFARLWPMQADRSADMPRYRSALDNGIQRLFHYQKYTPDFLDNTIKNGVVRFGQASKFNDPWDCKPSFHVPEDQSELRALVDFMQRASECHTPHVDPANREAQAEQYLANPHQLRRVIADTSEKMWAQMDRLYRLYCLSTKPDHPLMWGHYADNHRGVCLEFDVRTRDFCQAIQVDYSAEYPQFSLSDGDDLSPFHSKSADWSYEQEYRLVAQEASEALGSGTLMTHDSLYELSRGSLLSITIGDCAPASTYDEVAEMARPAGILVRKATRVPHRYALNIDPPF
jgi:hypothetical protein